MPVPKRKRSHARKYSRNANKGVDVKSVAHCSNCQEPQPSHQMCANCGFYKGVKVMRTKAERLVSRSMNRSEIMERRKQAAAAQSGSQEQNS